MRGVVRCRREVVPGYVFRDKVRFGPENGPPAARGHEVDTGVSFAMWWPSPSIYARPSCRLRGADFRPTVAAAVVDSE